MLNIFMMLWCFGFGLGNMYNIINHHGTPFIQILALIANVSLFWYWFMVVCKGDK